MPLRQAHPAAAPATSSMPSLPAKVWHTILAEVGDPEHLWTVCRTVCICWSVAVPKVLRNDILRNPDTVQVSFDHGWDMHSQRHVETILVFDRLDSDDPKRCIFAELEKYACQSTVQLYPGLRPAVRIMTADDRWKRIKRAMRDHLEGVRVREVTFPGSSGLEDNIFTSGRRRQFDRYPYLLRVYRHVDDIFLPGLRFDPDRHEISFEWHTMFREFFQSRHEVDRRLHNSMRATKLHLPLDKVQLDDDLAWAAQLHAERQKHEHQVRGERVHRHFQKTKDSVRMVLADYEVESIERYKKNKLKDAQDACVLE